MRLLRVGFGWLLLVVGLGVVVTPFIKSNAAQVNILWYLTDETEEGPSTNYTRISVVKQDLVYDPTTLATGTEHCGSIKSSASWVNHWNTGLFYRYDALALHTQGNAAPVLNNEYYIQHYAKAPGRNLKSMSIVNQGDMDGLNACMRVELDSDSVSFTQWYLKYTTDDSEGNF